MNKLVLIGRRTFVWACGLLIALTVAEPVLAGSLGGGTSCEPNCFHTINVPEPSTLGLVAAGVVAAVWLARRNRRK